MSIKCESLIMLFWAFGYEEMGKGHGEWNQAISAFQTGLEITA